MNTKILQITVLAVTLLGTLGVPELATNWLHGHAVAYSVFVAVGIVLHAIFPSIFATAPSQAEQTAASEPGKKTTVAVVTKTGAMVLLMLAFGLHAQAQATIQNFYAAGLSANSGQTGAQAVAGTAFYAHAISPDTTNGMYAFTAVDAVPNTLKPFTVNTNIGAGIAQKVATIAGVAIFAPTAAGISFNGVNTGWEWNVGAFAPIRIKNTHYYIVASVRMLKSSIGGDGYKPIGGIQFGWGN